MPTPDRQVYQSRSNTSFRFAPSDFLTVLAFVSSAEIRGGVFAATTVVRPAITLQQPVAVRVLECDSSLRRYLVAGHVLHNARRLQGPAHTSSLCPSDISQRHGQLSYAVLPFLSFFLSFVTETFLFSNASRLSGVISSCPARVDSISSHSMTHCVHSRSRAVSERMPCYTRFYAFFVTPSSVFTPTPLFTFFFSIV